MDIFDWANDLLRPQAHALHPGDEEALDDPPSAPRRISWSCSSNCRRRGDRLLLEAARAIRSGRHEDNRLLAAALV
jgi:hypothetical protein